MNRVRRGCPGGFFIIPALPPACPRPGRLHGLPLRRYLFDSYLHRQHMDETVFLLKLF
jgi:hypothetical protein